MNYFFLYAIWNLLILPLLPLQIREKQLYYVIFCIIFAVAVFKKCRCLPLHNSYATAQEITVCAMFFIDEVIKMRTHSVSLLVLKFKFSIGIEKRKVGNQK